MPKVCRLFIALMLTLTAGHLVLCQNANTNAANNNGVVITPLSRWFDADPKGRNAGWSGFLLYGYDQAAARDARRFGARGTRSDLLS